MTLEDLYPKFTAYSRRWLQEYGLQMWHKDIVQNCLIEVLLNGKYDELMCKNDNMKHFYNYFFCVLKNRLKDFCATKKTFCIIDNIDLIDGYFDTPISNDDFDRWRETCANTRQDNFFSLESIINPMDLSAIKTGWVSGWCHAYTHSNGRRYAYWQYSAYVGSRAKGEIPKRIKTSSERIECIKALIDYNINNNGK